MSVSQVAIQLTPDLALKNLHPGYSAQSLDQAQPDRPAGYSARSNGTAIGYHYPKKVACKTRKHLITLRL